MRRVRRSSTSNCFHDATGTHRLDRVEAESAGEDRQADEERALRIGQEVEAPVESGLQGPVTGERHPAAAGEQPEPIVERAGDLLGRQGLDPCRGELDREWNPVQSPADLDDRVRVLRGERERGLHGACPIDEQPDRFRVRR